MNVWLPCPCYVVAPAILQSLIVPLCSPRGCCVVLVVSECNTAKSSFSAVCPPWEAFDQLRCCVCFRVSLLACSAPSLSGVLSELKPGFLQIVFSRIRRRVHDFWCCGTLWGRLALTTKCHNLWFFFCSVPIADTIWARLSQESLQLEGFVFVEEGYTFW